MEPAGTTCLARIIQEPFCCNRGFAALENGVVSFGVRVSC